jgi:rubrerythrin
MSTFQAIVTWIVIVSGMAAILYATYRKGRNDERYDKKYLCPDCGEEKLHENDDQCPDCRRKLWGEMGQ